MADNRGFDVSSMNLQGRMDVSVAARQQQLHSFAPQLAYALGRVGVDADIERPGSVAKLVLAAAAGCGTPEKAECAACKRLVAHAPAAQR